MREFAFFLEMEFILLQSLFLLFVFWELLGFNGNGLMASILTWFSLFNDFKMSI